jgi:hypothetical protein
MPKPWHCLRASSCPVGRPRPEGVGRLLASLPTCGRGKSVTTVVEVPGPAHLAGFVVNVKVTVPTRSSGHVRHRYRPRCGLCHCCLDHSNRAGPGRPPVDHSARTRGSASKPGMCSLTMASVRHRQTRRAPVLRVRLGTVSIGCEGTGGQTVQARSVTAGGVRAARIAGASPASAPVTSPMGSARAMVVGDMVGVQPLVLL